MTKSADTVNDPDGFDQWAAPGYPVFLGSEFSHPEPAAALFHVLPVPYEATVSYGAGTGGGPAAILAASWQLEAWDVSSRPTDLGIHTLPPVDVSGDADSVLAGISAATAAIVSAGHMPVMLGGEHSVTDAAVQGLLAAGIEDLGVVQIDAHADLRDTYEGNRRSHATVMKRVVDRGIPLYQLGIRACCEEELAARRTHGVYHKDAEQLVPQGITTIELPQDFPAHVYFTVDVDGMDPSVFPATGTPVPGGLGWYQTLSLFESVARQRRIIGFDVVEFAPIEGFHAYDFAAALLVYRLMGIVQRTRASLDGQSAAAAVSR